MSERPSGRENQKHWMWNSVVNGADVATFVFSMSVISVSVVLPAFMTRLGASAMLVALLPMIQTIGFRIPQVFTPFFIEGRRQLKPFVTTVSFFHRLPWVVISLCAMCLALSHPHAVLAVLVGGLLASNVLSGVNHPAWAELIARVIPERNWGRTMGVTHMAGNALSVLGGVIVTFVLSAWSYPSNYAVLFLIAGGLQFVSHCLLCLNRETVPETVHKGHDNLGSYFRALSEIVRRDRSLVWFCVHQAVGFSAIMGLGLFMVYAMKMFGVSDAQSGLFVVTSTAATLVVSPILGAVGDKWGHKSTIVISCAAYVAAAVCAAMARSGTAMYVVFAFTAVSMSAQMIGFRNAVYELAPLNRGPSYVALTNLLPAPFAVLFAVVGGWLAEAVPGGFRIVFVSSAVLNLVALVILVRLVHPRQPPEHGYLEEV